MSSTDAYDGTNRYSPHAVAEHAVALVLTLNRKIHRAQVRVRGGNFSLEGLVGLDVHGKTAGICRSGRIGSVAARIFAGFGCRVIAHGLRPSEVVTREDARGWRPLCRAPRTLRRGRRPVAADAAHARDPPSARCGRTISPAARREPPSYDGRQLRAACGSVCSPVRLVDSCARLAILGAAASR